MRPASDLSPFIIAEIGASHNGSLERCLNLIGAAKRAGADAVKFQAFTPDTITLNCDRPEFLIADGPWKGWRLYELYYAAQTPRKWFPILFEVARNMDLVPFASVFSPEDCDFVMQFNPDLMKIASFEITDIPLIEHVGRAGKPLLLSTGMATEKEIEMAIDRASEAGAEDVISMCCVSSYPASASAAPLARGMSGISDHSIGIEIPVAATALGAFVIEKHLTLSRKDGGLDDGFASEPHEFADMVRAVRDVYTAIHRDQGIRVDVEHHLYRRSLFVTKDIECGEPFTSGNVRSIRPGYGLPPIELPTLLGRVAACDLAAGTPMKWRYVDEV